MLTRINSERPNGLRVPLSRTISLDKYSGLYFSLYDPGERFLVPKLASVLNCAAMIC